MGINDLEFYVGADGCKGQDNNTNHWVLYQLSNNNKYKIYKIVGEGYKKKLDYTIIGSE